VALKFNVIQENVLDRRVIMIDDSIVRGNTMGPLIKLLRNAGAKEVHVAITCPPIAHPCFMGVDMGRHEDLIAHQRTVDEIREHVGADSLYYLSVEGHDASCTARGWILSGLFHGAVSHRSGLVECQDWV
jgi:amidophosphoribosyltransferase